MEIINTLLIYQYSLEKCKRKRVDELLGEKLKELNGLSAEKILSKCGQMENVPVDLDDIINKLGIYKYPTTFENIEKVENRGKISGLVLLNNDNDIGIFYKEDDPMVYKRMIIAHELGHCCLHGEILKDGYIEFFHNDKNNNDSQEQEATIFASRLLIPKKQLKKIHKKLLKPSIEGLAEIFQVPKKLMKMRLQELELLHY